jgi:hypothetical protein
MTTKELRLEDLFEAANRERGGVACTPIDFDVAGSAKDAPSTGLEILLGLIGEDPTIGVGSAAAAVTLPMDPNLGSPDRVRDGVPALPRFGSSPSTPVVATERALAVAAPTETSVATLAGLAEGLKPDVWALGRPLSVIAGLGVDCRDLAGSSGRKATTLLPPFSSLSGRRSRAGTSATAWISAVGISSRPSPVSRSGGMPLLTITLLSPTT